MSRDLRSYTRQTNIRLLIGFIILLVLIGDGSIYLIYGPPAAISGLVCIVAGLAPITLIYLSLVILERIAIKGNE